MTNQELFTLAQLAADRSYAPYSHFHVGAALLTATGEVFTGCNIENSSYGASICAERTAAVKAISEGFTEFAAIAVAGYAEEPADEAEQQEGEPLHTLWQPREAMPCGICRQFLCEVAPALPVITQKEDGTLRESTLDVLLAGQFHLE